MYRSREIINMHNGRRVNASPIVKHREKMRSCILMWISCILIRYRFTNKRRSSIIQTIRLPRLAR